MGKHDLDTVVWIVDSIISGKANNKILYPRATRRNLRMMKSSVFGTMTILLFLGSINELISAAPTVQDVVARNADKILSTSLRTMCLESLYNQRYVREIGSD